MTRTLLITCIALATAALRAEELTSKHQLVGLSAAERMPDFHKTMAALNGVQLVSLDPDRAEITLRYEMEALFPKPPPNRPKPAREEIERRLNEVIGAACARTFSLRPLSELPGDKVARIDISVGLLDCKACRYAAYSAVMKVDGVIRASVNMKTHVLSAWIDATKTTRPELEGALKKARVELREP